ncbi:MAG: DNA/RNA non-specific endonuclease [Bacteroidota bacterium]|nr:DNA/RNA non-specific endonuclease [Bacteroidota bacterium]
MKKIFLFTFIFSTAYSQNDSVYRAEHLAMGNPNNAVSKISSPRNYLMVKPQFVHSYNRFYGIPNWVAWHVDSTWLGEIKRSNDFRADSTLPEQWYHVNEKSYRRSGYDRGHMCPSGDRTTTQKDNSITFLMTNMIPQAPNNNQGPWAALEIYCRELVKQGKELYIYCGGNGEQKFIDSGRVLVPKLTWKTILVLDAGSDDINRVTSTTRTIAVVMPNDNSLISKHDDWKIFRVSVDSVESLTGYNFFSSLPKTFQSIIERSVDSE